MPISQFIISRAHFVINIASHKIIIGLVSKGTLCFSSVAFSNECPRRQRFYVSNIIALSQCFPSGLSEVRGAHDDEQQSVQPGARREARIAGHAQMPQIKITRLS